MDHDSRDLVNRGNNLLAVGLLATIGIGIVTEVFREDEVLHKADDAALFLLGVGALLWYFAGRNRFKRSLLPLGLLVCGMVVKGLAAFALETGDQADVGDDIGVLTVFIVAIVISALAYFRSGADARAATPQAIAAEAPAGPSPLSGRPGTARPPYATDLRRAPLRAAAIPTAGETSVRTRPPRR